MIKVSDYIAAFLHSKSVPAVFELSGGMITHLLDSLNRHGGVPIVSTRHEQAAAFAADAVGRLTGIPGVAMATSGPGAINLLTGIGSCHFDSSPAVFITGQVNRNEQKGNRPIRQLGFQETDIVGMVGPITKAAWRITAAEQVPGMLAEAFRLATEGRPGPVILDIPMDVQRTEFEPPIEAGTPTQPVLEADPETREVWNALLASKRPLLLIGGGIRASQSTHIFKKLLESVPVPVVHSLMAVDVLPFESEHRVGMIGSYGNRWANKAVSLSDLIIVLGSRLDVRQTGSAIESFKGAKRIFHVDCESGELNNRITGCDVIRAELRQFLTAFSNDRPLIPTAFLELLCGWRRRIQEMRATWPDTNELREVKGINPNAFMHEFSNHAKSASAYCVDVGQHQMWAAQSLELGPEQRFLTSGGMGSMGFALPAAIGAACCSNGRPVVVIAGDGGFQCNIQELQTVAHHKLPIKMVVMNNHCHGMVRQFQESYFEKRYQSTYWGYSAPSFIDVAKAYGIGAAGVRTPEELNAALGKFWEDPLKPALLEVDLDTFANAYPKMLFNSPVDQMEPLDGGVAGSF